MARTEVVTITNMCMVYEGNKVLVQEKIDDDYCGITFPGGHVESGEWKEELNCVLKEYVDKVKL